MTCQKHNGKGESSAYSLANNWRLADEKYIEGEHHDLSTYYQLIKHFEYLLDSLYRDQVISFMVGHFEKHLTEDLLQELKASLKL